MVEVHLSSVHQVDQAIAVDIGEIGRGNGLGVCPTGSGRCIQGGLHAECIARAARAHYMMDAFNLFLFVKGKRGVAFYPMLSTEIHLVTLHINFVVQAITIKVDKSHLGFARRTGTRIIASHAGVCQAHYCSKSHCGGTSDIPTRGG